jgi:hypothetical protein
MIVPLLLGNKDIPTPTPAAALGGRWRHCVQCILRSRTRNEASILTSENGVGSMNPHACKEGSPLALRHATNCEPVRLNPHGKVPSSLTGTEGEV